MSTHAPLALELSDELLDAIADRVAERLAERHPSEVDDGWLRGAGAIASYLGAPASRVYALHSAGRLACVLKDGSALVARRSELDRWVRDGGGKRP